MEHNEIANLQNNLEVLRRLFGWTAEDLGEKIGVTKQTISNLETKKTELSKTQYIAIRLVMETEATIRDEKECKILMSAISTMIDDDPNASVEEKEKQRNQIKVASTAIASGMGVVAAIAAVGLLTPTAPIAVAALSSSAIAGATGASTIAGSVVAGGAVGWMVSLLGSKKEKEKKKKGRPKS